ncbi:MAG: hypothetical protein M0Z76_03885 [Gammaproteobacteria bacterium]|nr:hypothetical protein [Gammaproteobacteria bacterium]
MDQHIELLQTGPLAVLLVAAWLALYVGRRPFHVGLRAVARLINRPLRIAARAVRHSAADMHRRNRAVLAARAREEAGARIEREFRRVDNMVRADLREFPVLQTRLLEHINAIEADYEASRTMVWPSPDWVHAVGEILAMKTDDPMMARIVAQTGEVVKKAHAQTLATYRRAFQQRDRRLARCRPRWRRVGETLQGVDRRLAGLAEGSRVIDTAMERYERIVSGDQRLDRVLASSALVRLFVSAIVLVSVAGAAFINYHLLLRPLTRLLADSYEVFGVSAASLLGLVVVGAEIATGMLCCDVLRITNLFPQTATADDRTRRTLLFGTFGVLAGLVVLESLLIFLRENAVLSAMAGGSVWQAAVVALLGVVLPSMMALVAIPLEVFVHALRTVTGVIAVALVRGIGLVLQLMAQVVASTAQALSILYDLSILPPLLLERILQQGANAWVVGRRRRQARP